MNLSEKMHSGIILACIFLGADRCKEFIQHSCISLVVHPSVFLADFLHLMYLKHILFALMLQAMNFFTFSTSYQLHLFSPCIFLFSWSRLLFSEGILLSPLVNHAGIVLGVSVPFLLIHIRSIWNIPCAFWSLDFWGFLAIPSIWGQKYEVDFLGNFPITFT